MYVCGKIIGYTMKSIKQLILFFCITTLISCDQPNHAFLVNKSGNPISVSLYFFNYDTSDSNCRVNTFIRYLMEDSVIKDNAKLIMLTNKIAKVEFLLKDSLLVELIYDTSPLHEGDVKFDAIKINSSKNMIGIYDKEKILKMFKKEEPKPIYYFTINK